MKLLKARLCLLCSSSVVVVAFVAPTPSIKLRSFGGILSVTADVSSEDNVAASTEADIVVEPCKPKFNLTTALFCAGLAFDAYAEPPQNSSRWERGPKGMNVAFQSVAFTRHLYKGLVEITPIRCADLPDEDDTAEGLITGGGTDAYLLVAAVEGQWKEDVALLEKESYHDGVLGLMGAAHVGRSRTAWSNVNIHKSKAEKRKNGIAIPYHEPSSWGKAGRSEWTEDEPPFYLYVQDPAKVRLVFTLMDDDVVGDGDPIGSAHRKLTSLIPIANLSGQQLMDLLKEEILEKMKRGEPVNLDDKDAFPKWDDKGWTGKIKLTSKPRKKDKNSQVMMGAAAGAAVAGPVGAAVGGFLGSMYEGEVRGNFEVRIRYVPIPPIDVKVPKYAVKGGLPGVDWGAMYDKYIERTNPGILPIEDGELCFSINHKETGGSCAVYRSLQRKLIVISFRGTCQPVDLITDASIAQDAWVEGEDVKNMTIPKVHSGFRKSMNSMSRRLKELLLATPAPGDDISQYDIYVTGHSLGGALSNLFVMDIAEFGIDAGRALPQTAPSDAWWKSIASTFMGRKAEKQEEPEPPRPKSLRMYNFGSPRVGNQAFADKFAQFVSDGRIDEAYRIVNGEDVVPRNPRTINALALGSISYEHCANTVLVSLSKDMGEDENGEPFITPKIWIEGESDDSTCPVRDGSPLRYPFKEGSLLGDIVKSTGETMKGENLVTGLSKVASTVSARLKTATAADIPSIVGIDRQFTEREVRMIQSIFSGDALKHHMEDEYYLALGRACGFDAKVGEELREVLES